MHNGQFMTNFDPKSPMAPGESLGESDLIFPLLMRPHLDPRPWGGRRLAEVFGKELPAGEKIGESWEVSAIPGRVSRVEGGPLDGLGLDEVIRRWPVASMGRLAGREFPLLVKFINAEDNLSVQVHPDDTAAQRLEGFPRGKSEVWIILDTPPDGAELIHGLAPGVTRADVERDANSPALARHLRRVPIHRGSVAPVTAGTVHAILAGTLLCEVQQSCDITYRLYDWDRQPPRPLHVEKSLEAIHFGSEPPALFDLPEPPQPPQTGTASAMARRPRAFYKMPYFSLSIIDLDARRAPDAVVDMGDGDFALAICLEDAGGEVEIAARVRDESAQASIRLRAGQSAFLPAALRGITMAAPSLHGSDSSSLAPPCSPAARLLWVRPGP